MQYGGNDARFGKRCKIGGKETMGSCLRAGKLRPRHAIEIWEVVCHAGQLRPWHVIEIWEVGRDGKTDAIWGKIFNVGKKMQY